MLRLGAVSSSGTKRKKHVDCLTIHLFCFSVSLYNTGIQVRCLCTSHFMGEGTSFVVLWVNQQAFDWHSGIQSRHTTLGSDTRPAF